MASSNHSSNGTIFGVTQIRRPMVSRLVVDIWLSTLMTCSLASSLLLILLIYVILAKKRTASEVYILNLLFNHLFTMAIGQPLDVLELYLAFVGLDDHVNCPAWEFFRRGAAQTDHWAALFLALNRLTAVYFPHHYKWWTKKTTVISVILASWVMGTGVILLMTLGIAGTFLKIAPWYSCGVKFVSATWAMIMTTFGATIPMALAGVAYGLFLMGVVVDKIRGRKAATAQKTNKIRIALMLAASYLFLMACIIPYMVIAFRYQYAFTSPLVFLWVTGLQFFGTCGNPVVFFALNSDYRTRALKLFQWKQPIANASATTRSLELSDKRPKTLEGSVEKT